jgi:hypothetical protein
MGMTPASKVKPGRPTPAGPAVGDYFCFATI